MFSFPHGATPPPPVCPPGKKFLDPRLGVVRAGLHLLLST